MEDARSKYPSLPSNYVSILQLQERWIEDQRRIQEEEERQRDPVSLRENDTRPKSKGGRKFRRNWGKHPPTTDERSQMPDQDREKNRIERKPRAANGKAGGWTGQVESRNTEEVKIGDRKPELLEVQKDGRTVQNCCQKSEMETVVVVGEEIKDDEQKTARKKKKKKSRRTNPRAEEDLAGATEEPALKTGNQDKFSSRLNQIHRSMEKLSVEHRKLGGSRGPTPTHTNGYQWNPRSPGWLASQKASGAGLVWVRKGETSHGNVACTYFSSGSGSQS